MLPIKNNRKRRLPSHVLFLAPLMIRQKYRSHAYFNFKTDEEDLMAKMNAIRHPNATVYQSVRSMAGSQIRST